MALRVWPKSPWSTRNPTLAVLMTADWSAGSLNTSLASFRPSWLALNGSAVPAARLRSASSGALSAAPPPFAAGAFTAVVPPPEPPPPADADPLPEQPVAAPARPDTTMIVAGTHMNRRRLLIETSVVVDGETGGGGVWSPNSAVSERKRR